MSFEQVCVTGGTGFIGRHVVRLLLERGVKVRLLVRDSDKARRIFGEKVEIVSGDILDRASVATALAGADGLIHSAGVYRFGYRHREEMYQVNVKGTQIVLEEAKRAGIARVVHVSTAGLMGRRSGIATEKDYPSKPAWGCAYKSSKWLSEELALKAARDGLPVTIVCPSCPVGDGDDAPTPTGEIVRDFLAGKFPAVARTGLNFASVLDVAEGCCLALERGRVGERYILGGQNLWLRDFLKLLAEVSDVKCPTVELSWPVVAVLGVLAEAAARLGLGGAQRLCFETAVQARLVQFFDCTKAQQELGWQAKTPLRSAIVEAVNWFRAEEVRKVALGVVEKRA